MDCESGVGRVRRYLEQILCGRFFHGLPMRTGYGFLGGPIEDSSVRPLDMEGGYESVDERLTYYICICNIMIWRKQIHIAD